MNWTPRCSSLPHCISQFSDRVRFGKQTFSFFLSTTLYFAIHDLRVDLNFVFSQIQFPYKKNQRKHGTFLLFLLNFESISLRSFWYHTIACLIYEFNPCDLKLRFSNWIFCYMYVCISFFNVNPKLDHSLFLFLCTGRSCCVHCRQIWQRWHFLPLHPSHFFYPSLIILQ